LNGVYRSRFAALHAQRRELKASVNNALLVGMVALCVTNKPCKPALLAPSGRVDAANQECHADPSRSQG